MNKKDAIRTYLLNMADDSKFNVDSLAEWVNTENRRKDINSKDVGNVVLPLVRHGSLIRMQEKNPDGYYVYTVIKNTMALWFAKNPILGRERRPNRADTVDQRTSLITPSPAAPRKKNRSPFVISIDAEIADLQCKIKRLNGIRKEFA